MKSRRSSLIVHIIMHLFFPLFAFASCEKITSKENLETADVLIADNDIIEFKGLGVRQSMSFYDKRAVFAVVSDGVLCCDVYNLHTFRRMGEFDLPTDGYLTPHANVLCFGEEYYSSSSSFPAMYVSSWNNGKQAFVYDIAEEHGEFNGSLVQIIDPSSLSVDIIGSGYLDWVVDGEKGFLYSISYHKQGTSKIIENNFTHVAKYRLPSLQVKYVELKDDDVIESFIVPVMTVFQDKFYYQDHIYVVAGIPDEQNLYPPRVYDLDLETNQLSMKLIPLLGEPEGFCYYEGQMWLNMYGSSVVYNLSKLI